MRSARASNGTGSTASTAGIDDGGALLVKTTAGVERIIAGELAAGCCETMLLAIDVGNTNIVIGVFRGETLVHSWRLTTIRERTSDELGILVTRPVRSPRDPRRATSPAS